MELRGALCAGSSFDPKDLTVRAEALEAEDVYLFIRLAVEEYQIRTDMTLPVVFKIKMKSMVVVFFVKKSVIGERIDDLFELRVENFPIAALLLSFHIAFESC